MQPEDTPPNLGVLKEVIGQLGLAIGEMKEDLKEMKGSITERGGLQERLAVTEERVSSLQVLVWWAFGLFASELVTAVVGGVGYAIWRAASAGH